MSNKVSFRDTRQRVLEDDPHIAWSDALWLCLASMTLEDMVIAWILLPICLEHDEHLVGNGHVARSLRPLPWKTNSFLRSKQMSSHLRRHASPTLRAQS